MVRIPRLAWCFFLRIRTWQKLWEPKLGGADLQVAANLIHRMDKYCRYRYLWIYTYIYINYIETWLHIPKRVTYWKMAAYPFSNVFGSETMKLKHFVWVTCFQQVELVDPRVATRYVNSEDIRETGYTYVMPKNILKTFICISVARLGVNLLLKLRVFFGKSWTSVCEVSGWHHEHVKQTARFWECFTSYAPHLVVETWFFLSVDLLNTSNYTLLDIYVCTAAHRFWSMRPNCFVADDFCHIFLRQIQGKTQKPCKLKKLSVPLLCEPIPFIQEISSLQIDGLWLFFSCACKKWKKSGFAHTDCGLFVWHFAPRQSSSERDPAWGT